MIMNISWRKLRETTTKVGYRTLINKFFELPNGEEAEFTVVDMRYSGAGVFGITKDNRIVIAKQYRAGQEKVMYDLPGGVIDAGETPESTAIREFHEETGYSCSQLQFMAKVPLSAYIDGYVHWYFATECKPATNAPKNDETEFIEVATMSPEEIVKVIYTGGSTDTIGLLLGLRELEKRGIYKPTE